jgi:hypothetical protein
MYSGMTMENLKLFCTKYNVSSKAGISYFNSGDLLKLTHGVYIQNPFKLASLKGYSNRDKIDLINNTIRNCWQIIVSQYYRSDTLVTFDTAYNLEVNESNVIRVASKRPDKEIQYLCDNIEGEMPDYCKSFIEPLAIKFYRARDVNDCDIESIFDPNEIDEIKKVLPFENYSEDGLRNFLSVNRFSHERLILEFLTLNKKSKHLALKFSVEFLKISLAKVGWPSVESIELGELDKIIKHITRLNPVSRIVHDRLVNRLSEHLIVAKESPALSVYWYQDKKGELTFSQGKWRLINSDGWSLPGGESLSNISPLINNLMPEMFKIEKPSAIEKYLGDSRRFMSNIRLSKSGNDHKHANDYFSVRLDEDENIFHGLITGLPTYDHDYNNQAIEINKKQTAIAVSGVMVKFGMNLSEDQHGTACMQVADDLPVTHLLKLPHHVGQLAGVVALEWLGMELAKSAGNVIPTYQLASIPTTSMNSTESGVSDIEHGDEDEFFIGASINDFFDSDLSMFGKAQAVKEPVAFLIERYDISDQYDDTRYIQFDMLVAFGITTPESKYDVCMEDVAVKIKELSTDWESDRERLLRQVLSAVLTCNGDMHAKNISMLASYGKDDKIIQCVLTPTYDFTVTRGLQAHVDDDQALLLNDTREPSQSDLIQFGMDYCEFSEGEVVDLVNDVGSKITKRLEELKSDIHPLIIDDNTLLQAYNMGVDAVEKQLAEIGFFIGKEVEYSQSHDYINSANMMPRL